jgi:hypothetical protein
MREMILTLVWVAATIALGAYMLAHLWAETARQLPF